MDGGDQLSKDKRDISLPLGEVLGYVKKYKYKFNFGSKHSNVMYPIHKHNIMLLKLKKKKIMI